MQLYPRLTGRLAAAAIILTASAAFAHDGMAVKDAWARSSGPSARTGAAYMVIENHRATDDRLIAIKGDIAQKIEPHESKTDAAGVMSMAPIEGGITIPTHGNRAFNRGADHIMLMGLTRPLK
ncbi:MAG TPA: copper chaperone PCu(A)C, partial [Paenirhodobacter sp.]